MNGTVDDAVAVMELIDRVYGKDVELQKSHGAEKNEDEGAC